MTALPCPSAESVARDGGNAFGNLGPALRRIHQDGPYVVRARWGQVVACLWQFSSVIELVRQRNTDGLTTDVYNADRCDGGGGDDGTHTHDGITDDEREELDNET